MSLAHEDDMCTLRNTFVLRCVVAQPSICLQLLDIKTLEACMSESGAMCQEVNILMDSAYNQLEPLLDIQLASQPSSGAVH